MERREVSVTVILTVLEDYRLLVRLICSWIGSDEGANAVGVLKVFGRRAHDHRDSFGDIQDSRFCVTHCVFLFSGWIILVGQIRLRFGLHGACLLRLAGARTRAVVCRLLPEFDSPCEREAKVRTQLCSSAGASI